MKNLIVSKIRNIVERAAYGGVTDSYDVIQFAKIDASISSARYYQDRMLTAKIFPNDLDNLTYAIDVSDKNGLFLEFGVASGRTINHIAINMDERYVTFIFRQKSG